MDGGRKYQFSWDLLGDIDLGRPNLGHTTRLEVYRLMQFTFRDIIEKEYGTQAADEIFFKAGKLAGDQFYQHIFGKIIDYYDFIRQLQCVLKEMSIGILRVEKADLDAGDFVLTISEDLDCSGLSELNYEICTYDEGFVTGLMENFTGKKFKVKEIDCWCTGDRTCRFSAQVVP
jgi:uncharacterized protein